MRASIFVLIPGTAALLLAPIPGYAREAPKLNAEIAAKATSKGGKAPSKSERPQKPGRAGSFAYQIKDMIRAKGGGLCASYGQAKDCIDEVEVCVTMVDEDDAEVRLCLNDSPGDRDSEKTHRTSARR